MTIEQVSAALRKRGFSVHKKTSDYWLLQGQEGQIVGLPNPEALTPEQRSEEISYFLERNIL